MTSKQLVSVLIYGQWAPLSRLNTDPPVRGSPDNINTRINLYLISIYYFLMLLLNKKKRNYNMIYFFNKTSQIFKQTVSFTRRYIATTIIFIRYLKLRPYFSFRHLNTVTVSSIYFWKTFNYLQNWWFTINYYIYKYFLYLKPIIAGYSETTFFININIIRS